MLPVVAGEDVLRAGCAEAGVDAAGAELIRPGSNTIYRLPGGLVARVGRPGEADAADKELRVGHWLAAAGIPAVRPLPSMTASVRVAERAVTFWYELPAYRPATLADLGDLLGRLHRLPRPDFDLPALDPLDGELDLLADAGHLDGADREWLRGWIGELRRRYADLSAGLPWCAVHGDAWLGNFVVTSTGPVLLDLERFAYGPPEWDLASLGLAAVTLGTQPADGWREFRAQYGHDVEAWDGFAVLRDICEIRKALYALPPEKAASPLAAQARYRVACLRGDHGPRPWRWWPSP